jgi:hypothetical protein
MPAHKILYKILFFLYKLSLSTELGSGLSMFSLLFKDFCCCYILALSLELYQYYELVQFKCKHRIIIRSCFKRVICNGGAYVGQRSYAGKPVEKV